MKAKKAMVRWLKKGLRGWSFLKSSPLQRRRSNKVECQGGGGGGNWWLLGEKRGRRVETLLGQKLIPCCCYVCRVESLPAPPLYIPGKEEKRREKGKVGDAPGGGGGGCLSHFNSPPPSLAPWVKSLCYKKAIGLDFPCRQPPITFKPRRQL